MYPGPKSGGWKRQVACSVVVAAQETSQLQYGRPVQLCCAIPKPLICAVLCHPKTPLMPVIAFPVSLSLQQAKKDAHPKLCYRRYATVEAQGILDPVWPM